MGEYRATAWRLTATADGAIRIARERTRPRRRHEITTKNVRGKARGSQVTLDPQIEWVEKVPTAAHEDCFIANSMKTEIIVVKAPT